MSPVTSQISPIPNVAELRQGAPDYGLRDLYGTYGYSPSRTLKLYGTVSFRLSYIGASWLVVQRVLTSAVD